MWYLKQEDADKISWRKKLRNTFPKDGCPMCHGSGVTEHERGYSILALPCSGCSNPFKLDAAVTGREK